MKRILFLLLAVSVFSILATRRLPGPSGAMLSPADQKSVLAFSETMTDNLLEGMNSGDYALFSKDFSETMLQAMPPDEFERWQKERSAKLGWYLRREVEGMVRRSDRTYTVIYEAGFQFNDMVLMRVVFNADPPHQIIGLSFDK